MDEMKEKAMKGAAKRLMANSDFRAFVMGYREELSQALSALEPDAIVHFQRLSGKIQGVMSLLTHAEALADADSYDEQALRQAPAVP